MTRNDTGIDACNLIDTIVQCKLRKDSLRWEDCGTFFGSQNIFNSELKKTVVRWDNLIITRNKECKLSKNLKDKYELYTDITFTHDEIINYCDKLIKNPPKIKIQKDETFKLRDYQKEAIDIINHNKNVIISLPTGCGKNIVIIFSMNEQKKYLILVPRIILMEQIKSEIIKHKPDFKNQIQTIGDNNNEYDKDKNITICVYNSISVIEKYCNTFDKIFIDEAHHINIPEIYEHEEEIINQDDTDSEDNMSDDEYYSDEEETESIRDDTEDEIKNTTGFNKIIKSLSKYNNNIYLSATIDDINDFTYYKKDIRDMIDNKYLCDYTIHIPIFSDDPSNKNICEHLLRNYKNIIIYCNSQKEGNKINELLNSLQNSCSEYIDCKTSKSKRDKIVKKYKEGEIPFLVNVRILVEGFDAPITKGVCFIHLPSSKTTAIQIIGRALRLHPLKTFANIILPFSNKDDESNINKFLKILAQNDTRIRKSYESKIEGGYISIEKIKDDGNDIENENDTKNEDIEFRYEMIYDSLCILQNGNIIWMKWLEDVKKYIDENNKRPSTHNENILYKSYGIWLCTQEHNYKNEKYKMKDLEIKKYWENFINDPKYKKYFISNQNLWMQKFEEVKTYINENNKLPSSGDKSRKIKSFKKWINHQQYQYKNNDRIMKDENIRKIWEGFVNDDKYKKYFVSIFEEWLINLKEVKKYLDENNKKPSASDKNPINKFYSRWIQTQQKRYKNKDGSMKDEMREQWEEFINNNKYKKYFSTNSEVWLSNLCGVKKYIDENYKRPSSSDKNNEIKSYGKWII